MAPQHLLLVVFICAVWAFTFIAGKAGVDQIPPLLFTCLRYILLALVLLPFLRIAEGRMRQIFAIAFTVGGLHFAFFYGGLMLSENVSVTAIATQLGAPFATILSVIFLKEYVGWRRWTGIGLAFSGVMIIGFDPAVFDYLDGLALVLVSALLGSIGTILMRDLKDVGVFQLQAWIAMLSWPLLLVLSLLLESDHVAILEAADWRGWGGVAYTALANTLIGHAGMFYLLQRYEVAQISPITLLVPVFGVCFGVTVWGDTLTERMLIGGLVALAGIAIIAIRKRELVERGA